MANPRSYVSGKAWLTDGYHRAAEAPAGEAAAVAFDHYWAGALALWDAKRSPAMIDQHHLRLSREVLTVRSTYPLLPVSPEGQPFEIERITKNHYGIAATILGPRRVAAAQTDELHVKRPQLREAYPGLRMQDRRTGNLDLAAVHHFGEMAAEAASCVPDFRFPIIDHRLPRAV